MGKPVCALPASRSCPSSEAGLPGALLDRFEGMAYRMRIDENWTMEFLSGGCLALTGHDAEAFLRERVNYERLTHADDRVRVRDEIFAALEAGRRFRVEYRIVREDGAVRWVEEHGVGVRDRQGGYVALEGFVQDVTQRKEAEQALHEAERRYRSIFENAVEGIFQSTPDKGYLAVNPALARMYGYASPEEMVATLRDIDQQLYVETGRRAEFLRQMSEYGKVVNFESQVRRHDGSVIWISENARVVRDAAGTVQCYEGTVVDISERKVYEARIRHQATHDALTGLPNRNLLYDRLQQAIENARRNGEIAAVAFIDLDQFKFINDSLGHQVGDELLKVVAERLKSCVRAADTVARQGGDEFVLVLPHQAGCEAVADTVRRIIAVVAEPWAVNGIQLQVTCSVGISMYPDDGQDADALLRNADSAMYKAKELGRNSFEYFSAEMNAHATERLETLNSLRHALANDEFVLHYQPKVRMASGGVVGAEALLRWRHPQRGMVPPAHFIGLAEESGMIIEIGEWVLRTACAQNVAWQRAGLAPIPISVNLSPRQLARGDVVEVVRKALAASGLPPHCLELEITETVVMRDVDKSLETLRQLKELGVCIAIDDFGTGYSSLNYLKRFPVDTLKIDRSFVNDIAVDQDDAAIAKAIISLGHILNLKVVAEGVENEDQRRFLHENGCDDVQGFHFGRPMPADAFAATCLRR
ncbi:putative bifunctional diguanylate cyclase/phosphodiesterase [Noviherbaspirillum aridicola]|uniref:GGDEF domain-containing protein n=1 Tax=Noviherbaspirillum aridicola TaxID=2849687 RepID=A0ABQ4Q7F1_9BURK|nr:bifunctional diguanylate cyclase/phosphodiesterase [Noviherbaspirillum aridicola]GIZ53103.1 GGDEF domain-containing protein [Noviherbaspirillum aridicola]